MDFIFAGLVLCFVIGFIDFLVHLFRGGKKRRRTWLAKFTNTGKSGGRAPRNLAVHAMKRG